MKNYSLKGALLALLYFIAFALCAYTLASCEKPQNEPVIQPETPKQQYHIEFKFPAWNIDFTDTSYSIGQLCNGPNGEVTGESIRFESIEGPPHCITILVMREFSGIISQVTGQIPDFNGDFHYFDIHNDSIHICNGPQTSNYYLNLYKQ